MPICHAECVAAYIDWLCGRVVSKLDSTDHNETRRTVAWRPWVRAPGDGTGTSRLSFSSKQFTATVFSTERILAYLTTKVQLQIQLSLKVEASDLLVCPLGEGVC
jgi:hypothetical protein